MSDASSVSMFDPELAQQLVDRAKAEGVKLTGPGGLLGDLTKRVLEAGLEGEMDGHVAMFYVCTAALRINSGHARPSTLGA